MVRGTHPSYTGVTCHQVVRLRWKPGSPSFRAQPPSSAHHKEMPNYYLLLCTQDPHRVRLEAQSHPERGCDKTVSNVSSQLSRLRCEGLTLAGGVVQPRVCPNVPLLTCTPATCVPQPQTHVP